jgi:ABC-type Fe3+ transport system permease subunit
LPTKKLISSASRFESLFTAAPAALIAIVCCVMPLTWMLWVVIDNPQVRHELLLTQFRAHLLERTLEYNGLAAILATLMGIPAALVLGRGRPWLSRIMWVLLPSALLMPSLSYAYGWSQLVRLLQDFCTDFTLRHFGINHVYRLTMRPGETLDVFRCIWSLAAWLWAVPAGLMGLALRRMDTNVQQQALLEGALYRITLRQLLGPMIASVAIVTVIATQEFAVYEPSGISVVATEVRMVFDTGSMSSPDNSIAGTISQGAGLHSPDQPARAAASVACTFPLLICTIGLAIIAVFGARLATASDSISVGTWPKALDAPWWAAALTIGFLILNVGVPVWALVQSLYIRFSIPDMVNTFGPEIEGAIFVGCVAALLVAITAFSAAGQWTPGLMALAGASFLVGGQLLAIALIRIYNRELFTHATDWIGRVAGHLMSPPHTKELTRIIKAPFDLSDWAYNAWPVPVIAYVGRFGWLAMAAGRGTWTQSWKELRDMAALDGAGKLRTAVSIVWPLAWPVLLAGALLVGALSLTEVPATVLLFPEHPQVLTPRLMTWLHQRRSDDMIKASLLMMMAVLLPALAGVLLTGLGVRMAALRGKKNGPRAS